MTTVGLTGPGDPGIVTSTARQPVSPFLPEPWPPSSWPPQARGARATPRYSLSPGNCPDGRPATPDERMSSS